MGKIMTAYGSTAANTAGILGVACPAVKNGKRRVYLHEVTIAPRGADWAADVVLYIDDTYTGTDLVTNGAFAADSGWTKGTGWTISSGAAHKVTAATTALSQTITPAPVAGDIYRLTYDLTETASGITPSFGGTNGGGDAGTGAIDEIIAATDATATLAFTADATAEVDVDNVTLKLYSDLSAALIKDSIRSGTTAPYKRTFETKQPWSQTGFSLYATTGGASCIMDMVMVYEVV
jgi:hypothetical protein